MKLNGNLEVLDKLIAELAENPAAQCELLREHLEAARTFLLGAMPREYQMNLRLGQEILNCLPDPDLERRMRDFIEGELHHEPVPLR